MQKGKKAIQLFNVTAIYIKSNLICAQQNEQYELNCWFGDFQTVWTVLKMDKGTSTPHFEALIVAFWPLLFIYLFWNQKWPYLNEVGKS